MSRDRPCTCYVGCDNTVAGLKPHQHADDPCAAHPKRPTLPRPTPQRDRALRVGDNLWRFDDTKRVYEKGPDGRGTGGRLWRPCWEQLAITGETSRSWLVGFTWNTIKLAKADFRDGRCPTGWALDEKRIDQLEWVHIHQHWLREAVGRCDDYTILREVARLVGYDDKVKR